MLHIICLLGDDKQYTIVVVVYKSIPLTTGNGIYDEERVMSRKYLKHFPDYFHFEQQKSKHTQRDASFYLR